MSIASVKTNRRSLERPEPVARVVEGVLERIGAGRLNPPPCTIRFWDDSELAGRAETPRILLRDPVALLHAAREPNQLGLARAWAFGAIELEGKLDELFDLWQRLPALRISLLDRLRLASALWRLFGTALLRRPPASSIETGDRSAPRHSLRRDRTAVRHHYDVPAEFHRLVIGPSMVYSCAYFAGPDDTLEQAQQRKLDLICRKLQLSEGDRLLDVGCGWGSLLQHAVARYGVKGVGITLSESQAELARERLRAAGAAIASRCEIRLADYREIDDGPFDAVASVGMYEHVGSAQLEEYVKAVRQLLRPGGLFLNHGIARIWPPRAYVGSFIDRFIFPDGELLPVGDLVRALESQGLEVRDLESLREHYGLTLRRWLANLRRHRERAIALGGAERERVWQVYLTASARAFEQGRLSVFQVLSARRGAPHRLPLTRQLLLGVDGRTWWSADTPEQVEAAGTPRRSESVETPHRIDR